MKSTVENRLVSKYQILYTFFLIQIQNEPPILLPADPLQVIHCESIDPSEHTFYKFLDPIFLFLILIRMVGLICLVVSVEHERKRLLERLLYASPGEDRTELFLNTYH
jgi:hypothetical protein